MAHGLFQCRHCQYTHTHIHTLHWSYSMIIFTLCVYKCLLVRWAPRSGSYFDFPKGPLDFPDISHIPSSFADILVQLPCNWKQQMISHIYSGTIYAMLSISQQTLLSVCNILWDFPFKQQWGSHRYLFFIKRRSLFSRSSSANLRDVWPRGSIVPFERSEGGQDVTSLVLPTKKETYFCSFLLSSKWRCRQLDCASGIHCFNEDS